jgi:hypothetical protein
MKNSKQWRFKTKEEFIKEFGENWTNKVSYNWHKDMDKYFGQPFLGEIGWRGLDDWSISMDMLTTKRLPKVLADGTIVKVGMKLWWVESEVSGVIVDKIYLNEKEGRDEEIKIVCLHCGNTFFVYIANLQKFQK